MTQAVGTRPPAQVEMEAALDAATDPQTPLPAPSQIPAPLLYYHCIFTFLGMAKAGMQDNVQKHVRPTDIVPFHRKTWH